MTLTEAIYDTSLTFGWLPKDIRAMWWDDWIGLTKAMRRRADAQKKQG